MIAVEALSNSSSVDSVPLLSQAVAWLDDCRLPERLAVGFSGGADSTALLLALHHAGHEVIAWHVDHGWRADSAREADVLRQQMDIWGIEFHSASVNATSASNREATARKARHVQFALWAEAQGIRTLCLAHHRDDQAETVCMRMLQGAGVAGCAGMQPVWELGHLSIVRPLLRVSKSMLKAALRQANVRWLEDASNRDTTLMRNHIRHHLFPYIQKNGIDPSDLFCRWQMQASRLAVILNRQASAAGIQQRQGVVSMSWNIWREMPVSVRACVLQRMIAMLFGGGVVLGRRHIELAESWLRKGGRGGIDLTRCRLSHRGKDLQLSAAEVSLYR
ncbi:MAG: tRNA lysidine(34) synthetase TilS [Mariprofundaceae bacterium]|nr:tRNA lysidine(34) synthetase TilS [Mariprofundaceae bacterium]